MAYRHYQQKIIEILQTRIAAKKRRRDRQVMSDLITDIREKQKSLNQFYKDYPYCAVCGGRRPVEHKHDVTTDDK